MSRAMLFIESSVGPRRPNDEELFGPGTLKREEQCYERRSSKERVQYGAAAARDARRGRLDLRERRGEESHIHHFVNGIAA